MEREKRIVILGSTGSIGESALRVVDECPGRFRVAGLAAGSNDARLAEQAARFGVPRVALADPAAARRAADALGGAAAVGAGPDAVCELAATPDADLVLCAMEIGRAHV